MGFQLLIIDYLILLINYVWLISKNGLQVIGYCYWLLVIGYCLLFMVYCVLVFVY